MTKVLGFLLILLSPLCMGLPWIRLGGAKSTIAKACFAYVAGYFLRLTLFHIVALPMTILGMHFSTMANVFTGLLVAVCAASVWLGRDALRVQKTRRKPTVYEIIYASLFVGSLLVQLYMAVVMDPTSMTFDDATYTVYSSDALATDYMFISMPQTGDFLQMNFRIIQSSLLFPAYVVRMTGMPVSVVERTFGYALNILLAYGCYFYMADDLYEKWEDRFIFLAFVSVIYIFGYHSHYSMTFRLLGPNSQGKAILAVVMIPLLLVLFRKCLSKAYDRRLGLLLFLLSNAACSLSLMGTGYLIALVVVVLLLSLFRKKRQWKHLYYSGCACAMPCLYALGYLLMRNFI